MKRLFFLSMLSLGLTAQTTPPLVGYSYTVQASSFGTQTPAPAMNPMQVILFQVSQTGVTTVTLSPQGTNVAPGVSLFQLANVPLLQGWYRVVIFPSPIDPTQPMVLKAPQLSIVGTPITITQTN